VKSDTLKRTVYINCKNSFNLLLKYLTEKNSFWKKTIKMQSKIASNLTSSFSVIGSLLIGKKY